MTAPAIQHERGVLDTNTVIMLPRVIGAAFLPAEPLITAVTLAELSVGPLVASTNEERAARQPISSRLRRTSIRWPLTHRLNARSARWPGHCDGLAERRVLEPTTR